MNIRTICVSASLAALLVASAMPAGAQQTPQSGHKGGGPQSMQMREHRSLMQGRGMGMARIADVNGYPGPMHVLQHAEALELSEEQRAQTAEIRDRVRNEAPAIGEQIVAAEKRLEAMFAEGEVEPAAMDALLSEIADLRARFRSVHLTAHLDQARVLTEAQIEQYMELRKSGRNQGERKRKRQHRDMQQEDSNDG